MRRNRRLNCEIAIQRKIIFVDWPTDNSSYFDRRLTNESADSNVCCPCCTLQTHDSNDLTARHACHLAHLAFSLFRHKYAMSRSARPRRPYRGHLRHTSLSLRTQPWALLAVFDPVERLLQRLASGAPVDINAEDAIICTLANGERCEASDVLNAFTELFEIARARGKTVPDTTPLAHLAECLRQHDAVEWRTLEAARHCVSGLRRLMSVLTRDDVSSLLQTLNLKAAFDAAPAVADPSTGFADQK